LKDDINVKQIRVYGRPEEMKQISIDANPVEIALTAYKLWLPVAERSGFKNILHAEQHLNDLVYDEAVRLVQPHAKAFENITQKEINTILSEVKESDTHASGFYMSALLNATELQELDGVFHYATLGYRLAPNKSLIVRDGSDALSLGEFAEGNIIKYSNFGNFARHALGGVQINFGDTTYMADESLGGLQINYFKANVMAFGSRGGLQLNFSDTTTLAESCNGGIQVNCGIAERISKYATGGVQLNFSSVKSLASFARGGLQINNGSADYISKIDEGTKINLGKTKHNNSRYRDEKSEEKIRTLLDEMKSKLAEIEGIGDRQYKSKETIQVIRTYDWKSFEEDMHSLSKQIEGALK